MSSSFQLVMGFCCSDENREGIFAYKSPSVPPVGEGDLCALQTPLIFLPRHPPLASRPRTRLKSQQLPNVRCRM